MHTQFGKHNIYFATPSMLSPTTRGGDLPKNGASSEDLARFWAKVERSAEDACWLWTGSVTGKPSHQYGQFAFGKTKVYAHRFAYEVEHGPVPAGKVICHSCDVTRCCNHRHLFLGSQGDNVRDAAAKGHLKVARKRNRGIKPTVVTRYLNGGVTAEALSDEFGIHRLTVHRWIKEATGGADQRFRNRNPRAKKGAA